MIPHCSKLSISKISKMKFRRIYRQLSTEASDENFRVLELFPMKKTEKRQQSFRFQDAQILPPREKRMPIDQDWPSVWPTAKTFRPSVVPLPLYQGYDQKRAPPGKYANTELMKIPNFLHLTPPAIKRQCAAIKKFCSSWPEKLRDDNDCDNYFPVEIIYCDYCHASPTIRDERSRIITVRLKVSALNLDYHGRDKLIRLVGPERYDECSGMITIAADRCPTRQQNYDYLMYIITAVHHESWVTEPWEHEKTEADMENFFFEGSRIEKHIVDTIASIKTDVLTEKIIPEKDLKGSEEIRQFGEKVAKLINEGENTENILSYKETVLKALNLDQVKTIS